METKHTLNGVWKLYYYDAVDGFTCNAKDVENLNLSCVSAQVPGNVELDLANAGVIDKELYRGMKTAQNEKFESYEWWYVTEFTAPNTDNRLFLKFDGVDCVADYYLNDQKIYSSKNTYIPQEIDISDTVKHGEVNSLKVHIKSAVMYSFDKTYNQYHFYSWVSLTSFLRKPAHCFGWDIFPRAVSAGLYRDVTLIERDAYGFNELGYDVFINGGQPTLQFYYSIYAPRRDLMEGKLKILIHGWCGEDSDIWDECRLNKRVAFRRNVDIHNPKLWWPYGYGEPNIYDTKIQIIRDDEVVAERRMNVGLRDVKLIRSESFHSENPTFKFVINGVDVMCRGSNWVPMDAYHSRDKERYAKALALASEIGCNMLRVWGGGLYEQHEFYDYCDRHGIMVWQDFMMGCMINPMDEEMLKEMETEFTYVVRELREHPSIVVWSGDNEVDEMLTSEKVNPEMNVITRKLLPRIIELNDIRSPYLESSPYISGNLYKECIEKGENILVERHLWGPRDFYKSEFYKDAPACFVSETGYHGCPCPESVRKIVDEDSVWPILNPQWTLHSSNQWGYDGRVRLMINQIKQLFGFEADNIEDFALASQISQAEAVKYMIERMRCGRPQKTGILWWNLIDGWPQMSDAVVDYFYKKKLAFEYIRHAQAPFSLVMDELRNWEYTLYAANDTLNDICGTYRVYDIMTDETLCEGYFFAEKNTSTMLKKIQLMYSDKRMLVLEWNIDGKKYYNHYLCGMPGFSFDQYKLWLNRLKTIYNTEEM